MREFVLAAMAVVVGATLAEPASANALTLACETRIGPNAFSQTIQVDLVGRTVLLPPGDINGRFSSGERYWPGKLRANIDDATIQWSARAANFVHQFVIDRNTGRLEVDSIDLGNQSRGPDRSSWSCRPVQRQF